MKSLRKIRQLISVNGSQQARALLLTEAVVGVAGVISSLEALWMARREEADAGIYPWHLVRQRSSSESCAEKAVEGSRLVAAVCLLAPRTNDRTRAAALAWLAASSALTYGRRNFRSDGSDQLLFQVQAATALARLSGRRSTVDSCLWYIALQSTLAYSVAGYSKLAGADWRSGAALPGILRTEVYGSRWAFELAQRHPRSAYAASLAVIAGECCFPLLYFIKKGTLAHHFTMAAGSFHFVNACTMGLGRFFWAFTSSYPAIIYTAREFPRMRPVAAAE